MRHKNKRDCPEDIPEIFKDLWGFKFIEELSFSKVKNEAWPKIRIVMEEDEIKVKMIRGLLQKYEFPFSNLKIVPNNKKGSESKEEIKPSIKHELSEKKSKAIFKADSHKFKFPAR